MIKRSGMRCGCDQSGDIFALVRVHDIHEAIGKTTANYLLTGHVSNATHVILVVEIRCTPTHQNV